MARMVSGMEKGNMGKKAMKMNTLTDTMEKRRMKNTMLSKQILREGQLK